MAGLTIPSSVVQSISRAKSLLRRDETLRALEALLTGLELYDPSQLLGKARFQAEVLIQECVNELNRQKKVKDFLGTIAKSASANVAYVPGQEVKLKQLLTIIQKALQETERHSQAAASQELEDRKNMLREKGRELLKQGDGPRGKATLRVLADEYGAETGIYVEIGQLLQDAQFLFEALEFFELAIEAFPKDTRAYQGATFCAMELREADKAVDLYLKALRQFGKHSKTMFNLAKAYLMAKNREKAFEYAQAAYKADPSNTEAKEMAEKLA